MAEPRQKKQEAAVGGVVVEQALVSRAVVAGKDNMGARGPGDGVFRLLVAELPQRVRVGPAAEDNGLGADVEALARHAIENTDADRTPVLFYEASHLAVVRHGGAFFSGRERYRYVRARVVVHRLVEHSCE